MNRASNYKPVRIGDCYGDWKVLTEDWYDKEKNASLVKVQCKCCFEKVIRKYTITKGISSKCKKCMGKENFTGYEDLGGYYLGQLRGSAKKRNLDWKVSPEYLWKLFEEQNFKCALTGDILNLSRTIDSKTKTQTASLDRIDNSKGYVEGNVRWIHKVINQMRSNRTDEEFKSWCSKVINYL